MSSAYTPVLSHFGVFCTDLDLMSEFYCSLFDLQVTDRGRAVRLSANLVSSPATRASITNWCWLTGVPLVVPAPSCRSLSRSMALTRCARLGPGRWIAARRTWSASAWGNALSIYFSDPESNTVKVYVDTPWYVAQPHGDPLELDLPDEVIWQRTQDACRAETTFMSIE